MGRKKPRKPRKGRASEQCITRRGLRIHQKGDQIKTLTGHRRDVASQSEEGVWYRVSFAEDSPTCECAYHTTGKGAVASISRRPRTRCSYRRRPHSARRLASKRRSCAAQGARRRGMPVTDGTAASTRRGRGTDAPHADGGSGTTWVLSIAKYRVCTSRWP